MFCCIRPPVEPIDRMITDIYKEYKVHVEALTDTQSAQATVYVSDDRVYKYEWLTEKAERRLGRVSVWSMLIFLILLNRFRRA